MKRDEKFANQKFFEIIVLMNEDAEQKETEKIEKSGEKIENVMRSMTQIISKSTTVERKRMEIIKIF